MNKRRSKHTGTAALVAAMTLAALGAGSVRAQSPAPAHNGGIWKAVVPPKSMQGEFDSFDPLGVAAGARIKADCSLNWIDPDNGKLYCFSSGTSLEFFLEQPHASIERARLGWQKLAAQQH